MKADNCDEQMENQENVKVEGAYKLKRATSNPYGYEVSFCYKCYVKPKNGLPE